jgi:L-ascorbate metabolism protein UlaG (beta-lactamase superfamily)
MASVVTDPYYANIGFPSLKLRANIVTVSHDAPGHSNIRAVKGERRIITGPGEYEIGGVFVTAILTGGKKVDKKQTIVYVFDFDGLTVAHLGDLSYVPSQAEIEHMGAVDIALVPVGGGEALTPSQATDVISLIEPSVVIPMHYKIGPEKVELGSVERFLSEMGITDQERLATLKINRSGLGEETQVVLLEPKLK